MNATNNTKATAAPSTSIRSVAVIGMGVMGAPMAWCLQQAGFSLTVCDRNPAPLVRFAEARARIANSPAECAQAELVLIIVANAEQVRDVILGAQGIVSGLDKSGNRPPPLVAIMSTISTESVRELASEVKAIGMRLIDAPVSGGALRAADGDLTIMAGGDAEDIETVRPVFSHLGPHLFHCGALGAGQIMKIVNNILGVANTAIAGEAYRLAIEQGLDPVNVSKVLDVSTGRTFVSQQPDGGKMYYAVKVRDRASFNSLTSIMRKDMGLAAELSETLPGQYPIIGGLKKLMNEMGDETLANWRRVCGMPPLED